MKKFDSTKPKSCELFYAATLMKNFQHHRRMDFLYEVVGDKQEDETTFGGEIQPDIQPRHNKLF